MKKFTDEQLSRILTAHENMQLVHGGTGTIAYPCCINQAAYLSYLCSDALYNNYNAALWFDDEYIQSWTAEEFIEQMQQQGLI